MPEKAVIYARYSSDNQRDCSIDQQVKTCHSYAEQQGYEIIRVYDDRALTGKTDKRPSFLRMIRDSAKQEFKYVIVYALDRFSRNKYDSAIYKQKLKENGVRVLSAMEHITDDPTGMLMESILEGFAQYYSDELSQKIHRGLSDNAEKCIVNGSIPLGYRRGKDGHAEIIEDEAKIVQEIFERVSKGSQLIRIAEDLNERGIRTKKGASWNKSSFNKILSNERYIGTYIYKETKIPNGYPIIIEPELFYKVQEIIKTKPRARGDIKRRQNENGTYLLTGRIYCGNCLSPMIGTSGTSKSGHKCYYYACNGKNTNKPCKKKYIRRNDAELTITKAIHNMLMNDELINWMADMAVAFQETDSEKKEAEQVNNDLVNTRKRKQNILNAIELHGVITDTTCIRLKELEKEEKDLIIKMNAIEKRRSAYFTKDDALSYLELIREGNIENKKFQETMIDSFIGKVITFDDYLRVAFNFMRNGERQQIDIPIEINKKELAENESASVRISIRSGDEESLTEHTIIFISGWYIADLPYAI